MQGDETQKEEAVAPVSETPEPVLPTPISPEDYAGQFEDPDGDRDRF